MSTSTERLVDLYLRVCYEQINTTRTLMNDLRHINNNVTNIIRTIVVNEPTTSNNESSRTTRTNRRTGRRIWQTPTGNVMPFLSRTRQTSTPPATIPPATIPPTPIPPATIPPATIPPATIPPTPRPMTGPALSPVRENSRNETRPLWSSLTSDINRDTNNIFGRPNTINSTDFTPFFYNNSTNTFPLSTNIFPISTNTFPPSIRTIPSSTRTIPPSTRTIPPSTSTFPDLRNLSNPPTGRTFQFRNENEILNFTMNDSPVRIRPGIRQIRRATRITLYRDVSSNQTICPIRREEFTPEQSIMEIVQCGHIFDELSLRRHFRFSARCPMCRYDIRDYELDRVTTPPNTNDTSSTDNIRNISTEIINNLNNAVSTALRTTFNNSTMDLSGGVLDLQYEMFVPRDVLNILNDADISGNLRVGGMNTEIVLEGEGDNNSTDISGTTTRVTSFLR